MRRERNLGHIKYHADGVNSVLWRYYLLLATRYYYAGNLGEAARYLTRAVCYAQDGVVPRHIKVESALSDPSIRANELYNIVENTST